MVMLLLRLSASRHIHCQEIISLAQTHTSHHLHNKQTDVSQPAAAQYDSRLDNRWTLEYLKSCLFNQDFHHSTAAVLDIFTRYVFL